MLRIELHKLRLVIGNGRVKRRKGVGKKEKVKKIIKNHCLIEFYPLSKLPDLQVKNKSRLF